MVMLPPLLLMLAALLTTMAPAPLPSESLLSKMFCLPTPAPEAVRLLLTTISWLAKSLRVVSAAPAVLVMPVPLPTVMLLPLRRVRLPMALVETALLTVMFPEPVLSLRPITVLAAVIRPYSTLFKPRVKGVPDNTSAPPTLIKVPAVLFWTVTVPALAVRLVAASQLTLSDVTVTLPVVDLMALVEPVEFKPKLPPAPPVVVMSTLPLAALMVLVLPLSMRKPLLLAPPTPPVAVMLTLPVPVLVMDEFESK